MACVGSLKPTALRPATPTPCMNGLNCSGQAGGARRAAQGCCGLHHVVLQRRGGLKLPLTRSTSSARCSKRQKQRWHGSRSRFTVSYGLTSRLQVKRVRVLMVQSRHPGPPSPSMPRSSCSLLATARPGSATRRKVRPVQRRSFATSCSFGAPGNVYSTEAQGSYKPGFLGIPLC